LTQALGTRGSDYLHPHIQRLVLDETGILLLCSDGLTDNHRIEEAWANYIGLIVKDIVTLDSAVASWVELANQKNGHDNTAVVIMQHKLLVPTAASADGGETEADTAREERAATTGAKLYGESPSPEEVATGTADTPVRRGLPVWLLVTSGLALLLAIAGWFFILRSPRPSSPPPPALPSEEPPAPSP
ncbi:MAG: serine/threonine protein phosphatase, partial [Leptolyngbyaceae cyanobacterium SM2_3_12]|nr:serine/threonine protein phosphatase [Leptolyngbyaceae cyanobacterium SM2_3_12]